MTLTTDDLQQINHLFDKQTEEFARIIRDSLQSIDGRFTGIEHTLAEHTELHKDHTLRLDRIERRQKSEQELLDRHDERITRVEKQLKLRPLVR